MIVAQKNHHTKFFQPGSPDNVPPGIHIAFYGVLLQLFYPTTYSLTLLVRYYYWQQNLSSKKQWFLSLCSCWNDCEYFVWNFLSDPFLPFVWLLILFLIYTLLGYYKANSLSRSVRWSWFFCRWPARTSALSILRVSKYLMEMNHILHTRVHNMLFLSLYILFV